MTGDGVNDAPALKQADIGVAMGIKDSEAAKGASEMVLADDNFRSIERAVEEGRTVFDNLKETILFILPTNGAEALLVLAAVVLAFRELPVTPAQILWVNMITAVTLALALAYEPAEEGIMQRPPRELGEPIHPRFLLRRIVYVSILVAGLCMVLFHWELHRGASLEYARTAVVNALVAAQLWYPFTYLPFLNTAFRTEPLELATWGPVLAVGLILYLVVEGEKAQGRRRRRRERNEASSPRLQSV